jgi:hypothetical protein
MFTMKYYIQKMGIWGQYSYTNSVYCYNARAFDANIVPIKIIA